MHMQRDERMAVRSLLRHEHSVHSPGGAAYSVCDNYLSRQVTYVVTEGRLRH